MADNVAQSIKDLDERIKSLDKGLENTIKLSETIASNSTVLGDVMMQALRKGSDESKEAVKNLKELNKTITEKFGSGKELKIAIGIEKERLRKSIAEAENELKGLKDKGGAEYRGKEKSLAAYKQQRAQLGELEAAYKSINEIVNDGGGSKASKEWLERTALNNKEKKALDNATNGYIKQTQAIQDLNRTLEELKQKRAAAEALPVTGVGKSGVSYKTDASKQSALGKIDKEIEATETKINNATAATQKFHAQLIALMGEKKTKAFTRALGVEEAEAEVQKMPIAFDRVIAQINQRAAQSKDKFAKQLVNAEGLRNEAKNAAAEVSHELNYIWRGSQSHLLAAWRNNTGYLTDFGRQDAVNQIRLSQEYKSNLDALKTQEVRDKLTQALTRYKDALQAVITLEEQQRRSAAQYSAQERAVEGVTRRFNENEQAIARVRDSWEELNVKKQAGLISEKDFKANTQKLLDEYDRLIAKRKEFETGDLGQISSKREQERVEAAKKAEQERVEAAKKTSKILTEERGKQALSSLTGSPKMNAAVQQQLKYMQQIRSIGKDINALQSNKNRSAEENALLEKRKAELQKILALQEQLNNIQKGSANLARQIDKYNQLRGKVGETTEEVKKQKGSLESMLPTLRRLASAFGVAFSVQGLVNFGRKLVETRGEFEMQFVAMKQIIGDVDAATKIWNQTMQQALQSPFKAMQLVDYTKKLAAYRIETDKLFDTTKRLADVSAGLGVDMGRLILAYGQVKTANFLRASEVRQFTEAGVNIYGELAKYFTEIEGRAVSTAEVVERVTKRMVLFSDVEEIFKRMTDEGGTFYNMQEVQAETVRGQIMKLHDAYDQMLNTIGEKHNGALKGMVQTLNSLVKNWRDVEIQLAGAGAALGILLLKTKALPAMAEYFKASNASVVTFNKSLKKSGVTVQGYVNTLKYNAIGANAFAKGLNYAKIAAVRLNQVLKMIPAGVWWMALAELVMHFAMKITETTREARRLKKEIDGIFNDNQKSLTQSIQNFDLLRQKIEQTNQNTAERHELVQKINNQYGEYLDNLLTEAMTVEQMAAAYANVATNMRNASKERIKEQATQKIDEKESEEYQDFLEKLYKNQTVWYVAKGAKTREATLEMDRAAAKSIVQKFRDEYLKDVNRKPVDVFYEVVDKYYGIHHSLITGILDDINDYANAIKKSAKEYENLEDRLSFMDTPEYGTKAEQDAIEANRKRYKELEKYENERYAREVKQIGESVKNETKRNKAIEDARKEHERILAEYALATGQASMRQWESRIKKIYGDLIAYEQNYNVRLKKELGDEAQWSEEDIQTYNRIHSDESNTQLGTIQRNKQIKESYERVKEEIEQLNAAKAAGGLVTDQDLNRAKKELADWELAARLRGIDLTDKKKGRSDNSIYSDRIRLLQDMLQKYRQAAKEAYGYAKAEEKTGQSFEDAWAAIMPEGYGELEVPTSYAALAEMLQRLEEFTPSIDKNGKLSAQLRDLKKAIADALASADLELSVRIREDFGRQMEEAFGNYELTLELQKINMPADAAKDILGLDYTSLNSLLDRVRKFRSDLENTVVGQDESGNDIVENHFDTDDQQVYANWMKKIEDQLFNIRKERAKQYTKYLEQELSERAKLEMQYVKDVAFVEANFRDEQKDAIKQNLQTNYEQALKEFEWKSFKESDFYVEMMQDLTSMPSEYLDLMMQKLNEWAAKADVLSPRALKEVLKAREKVMAAQVALSPVRALGQSLNVINGFQGSGRVDAQGEAISKNIRKSREQLQGIIVDREKNIQKTKEELDLEQQKLGKIKAQEELQESLSQLTNKGVEGLQMTANADQDIANIERVASKYDVILKGLRAGGGITQEEGEEEADFQTRKRQYENEVREIEAILHLLSQLQERRVTAAAAGVDPTQNYSASKMGTIKNVTELEEKLSKLEKEQVKDQGVMTEGYAAWNKAVHGLAQNIADITGKVKDMGNQLYDTLQVLGMETDVLTDAWKDFGNSMVDVILQALEMIPTLVTGFTSAGVAINAAMGIIGLIALAIQAVLTLISGLAKIHDAGLERDIQKQQEKIDDLTDAYARLEKQIEKTWDSVSYMQTYEQQIANIREQITAMEAQMRAEESKKNTDDNAVRQYQRDIQDAYDQLDELEQKSIEVFGGIGEEGYRSAAEGFVDAWKSAFLETGDGLQGLQDHFDEFLQDWFVKQATMRIAGNMLQPMFEMIDKAVDPSSNGGVAVTMQELEALRDWAGTNFPIISDTLEDLAGMFGVGGEGSLSGLAAGIQGMTEEQANILEAYWNSVRMYTASIDQNVAMIASALGVGGNSPSTNPMLQQMSLIAANTQATHQLLQSVTRSGHSLGGYGIKVFND